MTPTLYLHLVTAGPDPTTDTILYVEYAASFNHETPTRFEAYAPHNSWSDLASLRPSLRQALRDEGIIANIMSPEIAVSIDYIEDQILDSLSATQVELVCENRPLTLLFLRELMPMLYSLIIAESLSTTLYRNQLPRVINSDQKNRTRPCNTEEDGAASNAALTTNGMEVTPSVDVHFSD